MKRGVLQRKRWDGTRIVPQKYYSGAVIEVLFDGFTSIFSHPFWHHIWEAMIRELDSEGFRAVISMLKSDPENGIYCPVIRRREKRISPGRIFSLRWDVLFWDHTRNVF